MERELTTLIGEIAVKIADKGLKLSIVDSCRMGSISHFFPAFPSFSNLLRLSILASDDEVLANLLGVSPALLKRRGLVSEEAVSAMLSGVMKAGKTDLALAVACGSITEHVEEEEGGIVLIGAAVRDHSLSQGFKFTGEKEEIRLLISWEAAQFLKRVMDIWL